MKKISLCLLAAMIVIPATSSAAGGQGFVRAELGHASVQLDDVFEGESWRDKDSDTSYGIRGGYWFTPNFAVEAGYTSLYDKSTDGVSTELTGISIGLAAKKNFGLGDAGFFISGRGGLMRTKINLGGDSDIVFSDNSSKPYYGIGLGYDFNRNLGLSLNYDIYKADISSSDLDYRADFKTKSTTVGIEYRF